MVARHKYKAEWSPAMLPGLPDKVSRDSSLPSSKVLEANITSRGGKDLIIDLSMKPLQNAQDAASASFQSQNIVAFETFEALSRITQAQLKTLEQVKVATKSKEGADNGPDKVTLPDSDAELSIY